MATRKIDLGKKSFTIHPGALHRDLGIPLDQPIPEDRLKAAEHSPNPKVRRRAISAEGFKAMKK